MNAEGEFALAVSPSPQATIPEAGTDSLGASSLRGR